MEMYLVVAIIAIIIMAVLGYFIGNHGKKTYLETIGKLENNIAELGSKLAGQESVITEKVNCITTLTNKTLFADVNYIIKSAAVKSLSINNRS